MTPPVKTRMTATEYFQLPESMLPTELIEGELIEMPAPRLSHQDAAGDVFTLLKQLAHIVGGKARIAPVDVYFDDVNIAQPDVLWVSAGNTQCIPFEDKHLRGAPDLVVEVLSPGNFYYDRVTKFKLYERFGVREYWMVDPAERLVEVWFLKESRFERLGIFAADETFVSPVLHQPVECKAIFGE